MYTNNYEFGQSSLLRSSINKTGALVHARQVARLRKGFK
jgi:hypothetical protein